jgi:hypothetical protein
MKEHPILFSTPMVKAILEGRKTQTRRIIKGKGDAGACAKLLIEDCPYGQAGDRLWVRETFCYKIDPITAIVSENEFWYKATNPEVIKIDDDGSYAFRKDGWSASPWLPSIHMPRKASRLTLEITSIRVEKLQEITSADALKEGIPASFRHEITEFKALWDSINGKTYPWSDNPWVWIIEFERLEATNV